MVASRYRYDPSKRVGTNRDHRSLETSDYFPSQLVGLMMLKPSKVAAVVSMILLLLAVSTRWPYSFYTFLRIVVCGTVIWLAVEAYQLRKGPLAWVLGALAILFNPLSPIYMRRGQWRWFDFLALLIMAVSLGILRPNRAEGTHSS
jgi:hypothetical protein